MCLPINTVVSTNYGTGPFRITWVSEVCCCPEFVRSINGDKSPSPPHYHFGCCMADNPKDDGYGLNGYYRDENDRIVSVWNNDQLIIHSEGNHTIIAQAICTQLNLF